ncbi:hypothetical protein M3172_25440 [Mesobacillus subterraneus]|uniref:hypothetical protein n=1 Tax=Mesobacillus subterraneus TaxID=285983 RepID=UPI00203F6775|nr:hypothetical protein [Mesobacillus subterraneus]MCM3576492.1 hypothetical protein [Mesobacillus subterraneus]
MFSICFQLAGSILLTWTFLTMSPKEIVRSSHIVVGVGYTGIPKNKVGEIKKKLFEKYLSVIGILYIAIGYLIQLLKADNILDDLFFKINPINTKLTINELTAASLNTLGLMIIALITAVIIRNITFKKIVKKEEDYTPEVGEMRID